VLKSNLGLNGYRGQPKEVQAALLRSFETAHQEPNDSSTVYGVEDADLKDCEDTDLEDGKDADLEDGCHRRAALLAKRRREASPTTLVLLHMQMARCTMLRPQGSTGQRRLTMAMLAHAALATTMTARQSRSFKFS
jgi:hypothetical protein